MLIFCICRLIKIILQKWFRIKVQGNDYHEDRLIIVNRVSRIDHLLLSLFLPAPLCFILDPKLDCRLSTRFLRCIAEVRCPDLSQDSERQMLQKEIAQGKTWVFFLEGLKNDCILRQYSEIFCKLDLAIRPIRIEGMQQSLFSLTKEKESIRWFPTVKLQIMDNLKMEDPRAQTLFLIYSEMIFANYNFEQTLFQGILQGLKQAQKKSARIEDQKLEPLSFDQFIRRTFILGREFKSETQPRERIGLLMPTSIVGMLSFFALQAYNRIPVMLNFSSGFYILYSICQIAELKVVYSSRQFIQSAKLENLVQELSAAGLQLRFIEDFIPRITLFAKFIGAIKGYFPNWAYRFCAKSVKATDTAVILFTSGSEGLPKGVALSHQNILANCYQLMSRVDFSIHDRFFNALPIFHSFGLTAGSIIPLLVGNSCFFYPSPLHFKQISNLMRGKKSTIFFSTETFLMAQARVAHTEDFEFLRYIFAGAEKVKSETKDYWHKTFNALIYEGYGATEASPVIALNCPLAAKKESVGLILPAINYRIEPVDGISRGGKLVLRGPNLMLGYLNEERGFAKDNESWYDTGDIVFVDEQGFLFIQGRAKRFAKLGGEMISLTLVESIATTLWPERLHAALSRNCPQRGEQIILFSEHTEASKPIFIEHVHSQRYSDLLVPQKIFPIIKIPVLASGKIDYPSLERISMDFFPDKPSTESVA